MQKNVNRLTGGLRGTPLPSVSAALAGRAGLQWVCPLVKHRSGGEYTHPVEFNELDIQGPALFTIALQPVELNLELDIW